MKVFGIILLIILGLIFFINIPLITIGLTLAIWGIYKYNVNRKLKLKSKWIPIMITAGIIISLIGLAGSNIGQNIGNDDQTAETEEQRKVFIPEMKVLSEVIDEELIIKGETNLPDQTMLLVTLLNDKNEETEIKSSIDSGTFKLKPIPIKDLKSGEQTYHITLAEKQPSSVAKIIGENGELLYGDLVKQNQFFLAFDVNIPQKESKSANNEVKKSEVKKNAKPTHTGGTTDKIPVTLVNTIDGDTIKVIYDGQEHNVRYLLIDTPETNHPRLGKQPFGEEAKERNRQLVNSGDLYLEFDVGERFDKYGRLLAYVYVGNTLVQEQLLKEGLARVAYVYPPNTRHLDRFEAAQKIAKDKKIGIWSLEDYVSSNGFNASQSNDSSSKNASDSSTSNQTSNQTNQNDVYYKNCSEARNAGVTPIYKGEPGYGKHLDRDGDGIACES